MRGIPRTFRAQMQWRTRLAFEENPRMIENLPSRIYPHSKPVRLYSHPHSQQNVPCAAKHLVVEPPPFFHSSPRASSRLQIQTPASIPNPYPFTLLHQKALSFFSPNSAQSSVNLL